MPYLQFHDWKSHFPISMDHWPITGHWQYLISNTYACPNAGTFVPKISLTATFYSYKQLKSIESKPTLKHAKNLHRNNLPATS